MVGALGLYAKRTCCASVSNCFWTAAIQWKPSFSCVGKVEFSFVACPIENLMFYPQIIPCNLQGKEYIEEDDSWVDNPRDLVGKPLNFIVKIHSARGLPSRFTVSPKQANTANRFPLFCSALVEPWWGLHGYENFGFWAKRRILSWFPRNTGFLRCIFRQCVDVSKCTWKTVSQRLQLKTHPIQTGTFPTSTTLTQLQLRYNSEVNHETELPSHNERTKCGKHHARNYESLSVDMHAPCVHGMKQKSLVIF